MKSKTIILVCAIIILITLTMCSAMADGIVVAFEKREYSILLGKTDTIKPIIQGTKAKGKYSYSSSDESIVAVKNGQVKGIALGDATINCSVTIGSDVYNCSYEIHVLQPVTEIYVPEKEMVLPAGAILRELPYTVLPEYAANKEIEVLLNGKKYEASSDGTFHISSTARSIKYTFKTVDGSNISASLKVTIPKGAWFSVSDPVVIDDPDGLDFFYVPTYKSGADFQSVDEYSTNQIVKRSHPQLDPEELLLEKPFYLLNTEYPSFFFQIVHLEPLKVGKGQFVVITTGDKAVLNISVTRSAVYESIKYEQYQKNAAKNVDLRFKITGTVTAMDDSFLYLACDGNETDQARVLIPRDIDISSISILDSIVVKGVFLSMCDYLTETGLTKSIPYFVAEHVEKESK